MMKDDSSRESMQDGLDRLGLALIEATIEACKYGEGANALAFVQAMQTLASVKVKTPR